MPRPLFALFALFVAALGYLVASSLARRDAPVYAPSPATRVRSADWARTGDVVTIDASDGDRWRYVSLSEGHVLHGPDTARWELAARRYRITVAGALADLGNVPFEHARVDRATRFVQSRAGELENDAMHHWYRYSLTTHLLASSGHVYAFRARDGALFKLELLGYYCPGLTPGCVTMRYAPLGARAQPSSSSSVRGQSSLSSRDNARSASSRPSVWQRAQ